MDRVLDDPHQPLTGWEGGPVEGWYRSSQLASERGGKLDAAYGSARPSRIIEREPRASDSQAEALLSLAELPYQTCSKGFAVADSLSYAETS
jgi:hypothetical protein